MVKLRMLLENPYIRIMRLDHWIKQLFIVPGILVAVFLVPEGSWLSGDIILRIVIGLVATSLVASANYVLNEYLDARFDKYHPTKKNRAAVLGKMKKAVILGEYFGLAILGMGLSMLISWQFLAVGAALFVMGLLYNVKPFRLKDVPFVDVLSESLNNALRFLLGWFIVTEQFLPPASIVIGYWMFGAFLMGMKRYAEYRMIGDKKVAAKYRKSFRFYDEKILLVSSIFYALISVFLCGTFLVKYKIELVLCVPLLCALYCYYIYIGFKADSAVQKPEKLYKEKTLLLCLGIFAILFAMLLFVDMPWLDALQEQTLIGI